ncbi:MAG: flagellar hook-basal body protein [Chloroflexi bacterium]|nr:flagellar hook-basal body protein [Chloroflexota bacterium]
MATVLGTSAGALQNLQIVLDAVAANIANVSTAGYKRIDAMTEGVPQLDAAQPAGRLAVAEVSLDISLGAAQGGANAISFALQDDSFFQVRDTDGGLSFTRLGAMQVDGAGNISTLSGRVLEPPVQLPSGWSAPGINHAGEITATDDAGNRQVIGQLTLVRFVNPRGLLVLGEGMYRETANTGARTTGNPGSPEFAALVPGSIEASNVDLATEFTNLIAAQRAYQASARSFSLGDEMLKTATDLSQ